MSENQAPAGNPPGQEASFYDDSPTTRAIQPCITRHLPRLDPPVLQHLAQLATGLLEHQSVLSEEVARGSAFRANPDSNASQARRSMRHSRLSLDRGF